MIGDIDAIKRKNRRLGVLLGALALVVAAGFALPDPHAGHDHGKASQSGHSEHDHHEDHDDRGSNRISGIEFMPYVPETPELTPKPYALLEFFTTDCRFCKASVNDLNMLNGHPEINVIAYTYEGGRKVRGFIKDYGAAYPISRASQQFVNQFSYSGVPASFLVDTQTMEVIAKFSGKVHADEVLNKIN